MFSKDSEHLAMAKSMLAMLAMAKSTPYMQFRLHDKGHYTFKEFTHCTVQVSSKLL